MTNANLVSLIDAWQSTALIYTAIKLKLPDYIGNEKIEVEQLAKTLSVSPDRLVRLLRALSVIGVCEELSESSYRLSEFGQQLTAKSKSNFREKTILAVEMYFPAWVNLYKSMNDNQNAFEDFFGMSPWQFRQNNQDQNLVFNSWMSKETDSVVETILPMIDFSNVEVVADIAGGSGMLIANIVKAFPNIQGILFDQPNVIRNISNSEILNLLEFIEGDFFDEIKVIADLYLLKSVIHDWNDKDAIKILKNLRSAMSKNSRLIIIERVLPFSSKLDPYVIKLDIRMMAITGGRERNLDEFKKLLSLAELKLTQVLKTNCGFYLLETVPT